MRALRLEVNTVTKNIDLRWLAGFVDGEGCIHAHHHSRWAVPRISIGNTNKAIIDTIRSTFPGSNYERRYGSKSTYKTLHTVLWSGEKAIAMAKRLLPYLRVKHLQAAILSSFPYILKGAGPGKRLDENVRKERIRRWKLLKKLNKRGK